MNDEQSSELRTDMKTEGRFLRQNVTESFQNVIHLCHYHDIFSRITTGMFPRVAEQEVIENHPAMGVDHW